jgi:hypothetical protein
VQAVHESVQHLHSWKFSSFYYRVTLCMHAQSPIKMPVIIERFQTYVAIATYIQLLALPKLNTGRLSTGIVYSCMIENDVMCVATYLW